MQKNVIIIAVLLVVSFSVYYFSGNVYKTSSQPSPAVQTDIVPKQTTQVSNTPATEIPVTLKNEIVIKNFSFNPSSVTIKTGTRITWVNNDSVPHTVTFDSKTLSGSAAISPGQSFDYTFMDSGSINYHCKFHPGMRGNITVEK